MFQMTGAQATIRLLERQGIRTIAGIPGGANLPLYDALSQSEIIRHVLPRHEQGAGFIAQGMARVTGTPQVFFATSGPGATNTLTALADAKLDSVPIICITGQVPSGLIGSDAFQEVDIYGMSISATKHNFLVHSIEELLEVIPKAFRIASSGRPGPILIDIPKDIQMQTTTFEQWPAVGIPDPTPALETPALDRAAAIINAAKRPLLYVGGGVVQSGADGLAQRLAEKANIPAAMTLMGLGIIPSSHPLCMGMLGMHAAPYTNIALEECDLLMAVGVRFDDRATGRAKDFCPTAKIVHIDIDPGEMDKICTSHEALVGDASTILEALLPKIESKDPSEWNHRIEQLKDSHGMDVPGENDPTSAYGIILSAAEAAGPEAIVTTDVGQHQMRTAQVHPHLHPRHWLTSGGLGTMGFGLPAAIGAALAEPQRSVVCFSGDGSLMMNIQELATAVEQNLNVTIILSDNNALGLVQQQQDLFYGGRIFGSDYSLSPDFCTIAKGFGMPSLDLSTCKDPTQALKEAIAAPGPCLVRVPLGAVEGVYPMVPPGAANREMIGGKPHVCTL